MVLTHAVMIPSEKLQPFVRRFEIIETFSERVHTLLPESSPIACFRLDGVALMRGASPLPAALFSGVQDRTRSITHLPGSHVLLTVFTGTGAAAFLREPLDQLFNHTMPMDLFLRRSRLDEVWDQLMEARGNTGRVNVVERFLLERLESEASGEMPDAVTEAAVAHIRKRHGAVRMEELARVLNLSLSALERRFRKKVGASPRKFASIVRMRHVLRLRRAGGSLTEIAHRAGYCDQSHFIKDFKSFTGLAPESFFRQTSFC